MAAAGSKLEERAPEDGIYQGADEEGRLSFAENLKVPDVKWAYHSLHPGQVVALALTEVCCGMGIGKIFWFPLPQSPGFPKQISKRNAGIYKYDRFPRLIYLPFIWSEDDQKRWRTMNHLDRLSLLNAGACNIMTKQCIMPIAFVYDRSAKKQIRMKGCQSLVVENEVTLCITTAAYVGWSSDIQSKARYQRSDIKPAFAGEGVWWIANLSDMKDFRMSSAQNLIRRLEELYFEGRPGTCCRMENLLEAAVDFHKDWVKMGAGRRGNRVVSSE